MPRTPWNAITSAIALTLLMAGAWGWQQTVLQRHKPVMPTEPWQHVRERFPMPAAFAPPLEAPPGFLNGVIDANPFSSTRRRTSPSAQGATGEPTASPPPAHFIYKGRVRIGATQRAVLEELTTKKTYFLQMGQVAAGFKVLDIAESRVLLSNEVTNEEVVVPLTSKVPSVPSVGRQDTTGNEGKAGQTVSP